jgi:hypothetical protein
MLLALNATASAQLSIPDSCICYTDAQDIRCLECLVNAPKRAAQLENAQDQLSLRLAELELAGELIAEQTEVIADQQAKIADLERKTRNRTRLIGGLLVVVGLETIILLK